VPSRISHSTSLPIVAFVIVARTESVPALAASIAASVVESKM
jgi:hypothetical protein